MTQSYIVRFNDATSDDDYNKAKDDIKSQGGNIKHEYVLFKGFTAEIPDSDVSTLSTLESHPHVESVEKDQEVHIQGSS